MKKIKSFDNLTKIKQISIKNNFKQTLSFCQSSIISLILILLPVATIILEIMQIFWRQKLNVTNQWLDQEVAKTIVIYFCIDLSLITSELLLIYICYYFDIDNWFENWSDRSKLIGLIIYIMLCSALFIINAMLTAATLMIVYNYNPWDHNPPIVNCFFATNILYATLSIVLLLTIMVLIYQFRKSMVNEFWL